LIPVDDARFTYNDETIRVSTWNSRGSNHACKHAAYMFSSRFSVHM